VAERFGVPLRLRAPLGEQIRAEWSVQPPHTVRLRLRNEGEPVGIWYNGFPAALSGGTGQLSFEVLQDGVLVPLRAPLGPYVGPAIVRTLGPDSPLELEVDLSALFPLRDGASYEVACRYDGLLVATHALPSWPEQSHLAWTTSLEETLRMGP
jgi:hypothetical protein